MFSDASVLPFTGDRGVVGLDHESATWSRKVGAGGGGGRRGGPNHKPPHPHPNVNGRLSSFHGKWYESMVYKYTYCDASYDKSESAVLVTLRVTIVLTTPEEHDETFDKSH